MYSVVDIETTGGKASSNRITEIAIVKTDGKKIISSYSTLVNPEKPIDKFVVKLTGITDKMVSDAPLFSDIIDKIEALTKDTIFVAHNVSFDYTVIKREYKKSNKLFRRNNLCTVQLSRKTLKEENSYSLGKLSDSLGISIKNRHRALGDAEATAHVLHHIIHKVGEDFVLEQTAHKTQQIKFKGDITGEIIEELPEDSGTFRFLDKNGNVLYIGFAKNILSAVTKFLIQETRHNSFHGLIEDMFSIDYEVFNSFLITQLNAISEIKTLKPKFNKSKNFRSLPYGIFERKEDFLKGPFILENNINDKALWRFSNIKSAKRFLYRLKQNNKINPPIFKGDKEVFDNQYKDSIEKYLKTELYPNRNFYLIRRVSYDNKAYIVSVKDFIYRGYGVIDLGSFDRSIETLGKCIKPQNNNQQVQKIIKKYLSKAKGIKVVTY